MDSTHNTVWETTFPGVQHAQSMKQKLCVTLQSKISVQNLSLKLPVKHVGGTRCIVYHGPQYKKINKYSPNKGKSHLWLEEKLSVCHIFNIHQKENHTRRSYSNVFLSTCLYQSHSPTHTTKKNGENKTPEQVFFTKKESGNICLYYKNAWTE